MAEGKPNDKPGFMTLGWFEPLYRRVIVLVAVVAWAAWEWFGNQPRDQFWAAITLAMIAYAVWTFFINFDKALAKQREDNAKPKS